MTGIATGKTGFDTRRLADRSAGRLREHIDVPAREVIEGAECEQGP
jgi:hypothetical protein